MRSARARRMVGWRPLMIDRMRLGLVPVASHRVAEEWPTYERAWRRRVEPVASMYWPASPGPVAGTARIFASVAWRIFVRLPWSMAMRLLRWTPVASTRVSHDLVWWSRWRWACALSQVVKELRPSSRLMRVCFWWRLRAVRQGSQLQRGRRPGLP